MRITKKLLACLVMAVPASLAGAQTIAINGQTLEGVTLDSFSLSGGVLSLQTSGNSIVVDVDTGSSGGDGGNGGQVGDTTPPTLTIAASPASLVGSQTSLITFNFSEAVTGFHASDITVTGGTLASLTGGAGNSMVATLTPDAQAPSLIQISVPAGSFSDTAGNANALLASRNINYTASTGGGGDCLDSDAVVCNYNVSGESWITGIQQSIMQVPKGKLLISKFTTSSSNRLAGSFSFQVPTGAVTPQMEYWVSDSPNGAPLSSLCHVSGKSFIYLLNWTQFSYPGYCFLAPNTDYYFHLRHVNANQNDSVTLRSVKNNGRH